MSEIKSVACSHPTNYHNIIVYYDTETLRLTDVVYEDDHEPVDLSDTEIERRIERDLSVHLSNILSEY